MSVDVFEGIINVAVIAHVDHGKTTLIDEMLKFALPDDKLKKLSVRAMDSDPLEMERGITIYAKCTSIPYMNYKINIIDTPGHADFGAEVERIMSMASSVVLLIDSAEGVMPQTRFVLTKALKAGLRPIVVLNKMDKIGARPGEVLSEIEDLFLSLEVTEEQLFFPTLYAVGRDGWCVRDLNDEKKDLQPLFDTIVEYSEKEMCVDNNNEPFKMLVTLLEPDKFLGRMLIGKISQGKARLNSDVKVVNLQNQVIENARLTKLYTFSGLERIVVDEVVKGDIVAIAGMVNASVADTVVDATSTDLTPVPANPVDPPTMSITVSVNDSPLAGRDGNRLTANMIKDRLSQEAENNIAIIIEPKEDGVFEVKGRGELQLSILIENMRREGFELCVSRPAVVFRYSDKGAKLEPIEELILDLPSEFSGVVMEKLNARKGEMQKMQEFGVGRVRIEYLIPARSLIGYQAEFMTDTRGEGIITHMYHSYAPYKGGIVNRSNGTLVSMVNGKVVAYAIANLQDRGIMLVKPQDEVYEGMVVGIHNRSNDLEVNVIKGKQLTNMRASGTDETIKLVPPKEMTMEAMISFIDDDELVEVTPNNLRIRKKYLNANDRKRAARNKKG
ncbi:translational GTPase TypA [Anaplasmataceae bacterium AB001_6]|nr:translational GTPase TypA [Anaplasmataceae bacterium AB001_6]